ncbi:MULTISPECIES: sugar phosphate isomerase/epimerase family protein [unclassified Pantoea]|uniref:sugar phosphate isomerase/epimerase family protein n=1 Tax=unclassified Pantoea TaxID=2630326 RepID=UPI001CD48E01|nr:MULTISPECIES: sugar phosphate isomerase/epimerase [unclassified Pantoea]MCA1178437.1 sugar phosphate isomerase/epimerase [Pantoea sp. alder69]MCA1250997.1 sugar phosphate isomerase/epimerase [Pantoea sp. alder70]MCA1267025.1 sugar phosphate isomerase/epimerase [Pantoea sp. alder81]
MAHPEIIVVTAAYGTQKVAESGGQSALLPLIKAAGADGVEIRRELFSEDDLLRLNSLNKAIAQQQLSASYSVPEALWLEDGSLNPRLGQFLLEAEQIGAKRLKIALGHFVDLSDASLAEVLAASPVTVVVENDQTPDSKLAPMQNFFHRACDAALPLDMTFDMGNWQWTGEDAMQAAAQLSRYVSYIHVKAAVPHGESFRAVALDETDGSWRALLKALPADAPRGIEFPLEGEDLLAVTRHYVDLLRAL